MKKVMLNLILVNLLAFVFVMQGLVQAGEVKIGLDCPPNFDVCNTCAWSKTFSDHLIAKGMQVRLYPVGALGTDTELLDQVSQGLLEISNSPLPVAARLDQTMWGFWIPYLFDNIDHVERVIAKTDIMNNINTVMSKKGVRLLAIISIGGSNGLHNTKKTIKTPSDMKGLRMRALDEKQAMWFEAWGASSVVIPWPEMYNALQTGVANGYINPHVSPLIAKHTGLIKYFTDLKTNEVFRVILCSSQWYKSLSEKERGIVDDGVKKATVFINGEWHDKVEKQAIDELKKAGVEVYSPTSEEREAFAKPIRQLYPKLASPETLDMFLKAANAHR